MLWKSVRNGLFHTGFTVDPVFVSSKPPLLERLRRGAADQCFPPLELDHGKLKIKSTLLVQAVKEDLKDYVHELRTNPSGELAKRFETLWDKRWENS